MTPAAVWYRVSTGDQETDNQVPDVARFCEHHGYAIAREFTLSDSAWRNGEGGAEYRGKIHQALDGAWRGDYKVIVVWALDRITRKGPEDALRLIRQFRERGCTLVSVKESWLNSSPEVQDLLVAFAGWMAERESARRGERIRASLARRAAEGKPLGRAPGAKDRKPRRTAGYLGNTNASRAP
jgi:DNA invertase Pin-like site-specific DNA recombinase